jgi:hypothetical protein
VHFGKPNGLDVSGFYAQMMGKLTNRHYHSATIFVDHFVLVRFIHLMQDSSSNKMIKAKCAFKQFATDHSVKITHYRCNNCRFKDNSFKQAGASAQQRLTLFCGVNANFQNGIAKRTIRDLSKSACKQLLHAHARWPVEWPSGHTLCATPCSSTIPCQSWREVNKYAYVYRDSCNGRGWGGHSIEPNPYSMKVK